VRGGVAVGISLFPVRIFVKKGLWGEQKVYVPPYSKLQQATSLGVVACLQDLFDRITLDELNMVQLLRIQSYFLLGKGEFASLGMPNMEEEHM
jgi:hypothetical protein